MPGVDKDWKHTKDKHKQTESQKLRKVQCEGPGKVWGPLPGAELTVVLESAHPPTSHQPVIELPKMVFHVLDTWETTQNYPNTHIHKLTN